MCKPNFYYIYAWIRTYAMNTENKNQEAVLLKWVSIGKQDKNTD